MAKESVPLKKRKCHGRAERNMPCPNKPVTLAMVRQQKVALCQKHLHLADHG